MRLGAGVLAGLLPLLAAATAARPSPEQGEAARHLAKGVVSTPEHGCVAFAPDGRTLFVTRRDPAKQKSFIAFSRLVGGEWTPPERAPFSDEFSEGDPAVSPDGSRLVFWSSRPLPQGAATTPHLWVVDRTGEAWGTPRPVHAGAGGPLFGMGPTVAADGTIYFLRGSPVAGGRPWLSRMRSSGAGYGPPEYLDETVNGTHGGGDSTVAPDQAFLVFSSARPDSAGSGDLYVTYQRNGRWTEPRNLGPAVNSRENEYCPSLSPDGQSLYFTRAGEGILFVSRAAVGLD
jgi:Tol biopolymer transport system component